MLISFINGQLLYFSAGIVSLMHGVKCHGHLAGITHYLIRDAFWFDYFSKGIIGFGAGGKYHGIGWNLFYFAVYFDFDGCGGDLQGFGGRTHLVSPAMAAAAAVAGHFVDVRDW